MFSFPTVPLGISGKREKKERRKGLWQLACHLIPQLKVVITVLLKYHKIWPTALARTLNLIFGPILGHGQKKNGWQHRFVLFVYPSIWIEVHKASILYHLTRFMSAYSWSTTYVINIQKSLHNTVFNFYNSIASVWPWSIHVNSYTLASAMRLSLNIQLILQNSKETDIWKPNRSKDYFSFNIQYYRWPLFFTATWHLPSGMDVHFASYSIYSTF